DSTNVCLPEVALITSISFDHTDVLGNRLTAIAREKAGIVKPDRPLVNGATVPEASIVIEEICRERRAPLRQLGRDFDFEYQPALFGGEREQTAERRGAIYQQPARVRIRTKQRSWPTMELGLLGKHQAANAAVAVAC